MTSRRYTAADIGHVRLTGEAMIELANKVHAERGAARRLSAFREGSRSRASRSPRPSKKCTPSSRSSRAWSLMPTRPASPCRLVPNASPQAPRWSTIAIGALGSAVRSATARWMEMTWPENPLAAQARTDVPAQTSQRTQPCRGTIACSGRRNGVAIHVGSKALHA